MSTEAAPLLCAGLATFNGLRNLKARPGELVAIQGVGGLGHLGIQYARRRGFQVTAPNHAWLLQLCKCLHIDWNPDHPRDLQSNYGFELKFEGNLMAMVCQTFNLETMMNEVGTGVKEATHFFEQDKERFSRLEKMLSERRSEILKSLVIRPNESEADEYEDSLKWNREEAERLSKRFNSIPMP